MLRSQLLKDDPALQACLVRDKDHVIPGAAGNHVAKIQKALLFLDRAASIQSIELQFKVYGPTTTAAVLAYKRKRRIINFSYQKTEDNIVGKMTIARLDEDLLEMEQRVTPDRVVCGESGGGQGAATAASGIVERRPLVRRLDANLSVLWQETTAAASLGGNFAFVLALVARARELMAPHGLDFTEGPIPEFGPVVPDFETVIPGSSASCFGVRASAERVLPGRPQTLRIICCPIDEKDGAFGVTDGGTVSDWTFPKFCLINSKKRNPDQGTALHEMIHAAKTVWISHDTDQKSVYSAGQSRTILPPQHAETLANGFFGSPRR